MSALPDPQGQKLSLPPLSLDVQALHLVHSSYHVLTTVSLLGNSLISLPLWD